MSAQADLWPSTEEDFSPRLLAGRFARFRAEIIA
jgi:hypothetical protein